MATKLEKVKGGKEVGQQENGHQEPAKRKGVPGGLSDAPSSIGPAEKKGGDTKKAKAAVLKTVVPKKVELPKLEPKQVTDFTFVFDTLAIDDAASGIASLTVNLISLKAAQARLEGANIHPLSSMVLFSKDLKVKVVRVHEAFTTWWSIAGVTSLIGQNAWTQFEAEMTENLETFHGNKKIEPFLDEFAEKTGLKKAELQKFVKAKNWPGFIKYCLGIK